MGKEHFIENDDIMEQWRIWKSSARKVENRTPPEKLVQQMYVIATHLLNHQRFVRYPWHEKQDMIQEAVIKCVHNLKNFNPEKGSVFNYFTRCCWTAYIVHLTKYYKDMNNKRELVLRVLNNLDEDQLANTNYLRELLGDISGTLDEIGGRGHQKK